MNTPYMPEAKSADWATPWKHFRPLHQEFNFTVDVAARDFNTKVPEHWFGPEVDGLAQSWRGERAWCNPPYGFENIERWVAKARAEAAGGTTTVLLLPNTTETKWFHRHVWDVRANRARPGIELRFFAGRIQFDPAPGTPASSNVKGSILVVVRPAAPAILCPACHQPVQP